MSSTVSTSVTKKSNAGWGIFNIRASILTKLALAIVVSQLISPTISNLVIKLINTSGLISSSYAVLVSTLVNLIVVSAFILLLARQLIIKPIRVLLDVSNKIAQGDLVTEGIEKIKQRDQIGELASAISIMGSQMREIIGNAQNSALQVAQANEQLSSMLGGVLSSTEQVALSMTSVAQDNDQQNSNVAKASDNLIQAASLIAEGANEANHAKELVKLAEQAAISGELSVTKSIDKVQIIKQKVELLSNEINGLEQQSTAINDIVQTISGIADQTNLLALNAAIEAARAGENGRGFAVVAEEVRKLAENSAKSTTEISSIIATIQAATQRASDFMEESKNEVEQGVALIKDTGHIFDDIKDAVSKTAGVIEDMAEKTKKEVDQILAVQQITREISSFAENIAAASEEVSASAEEQSTSLGEISNYSLNASEIANNLREAMSRFTV